VLVTGLWRRRLIYGCVALIITVWLFQVFVMPLPIVRLYVFLVAVVGSIYCGWRTVVSSRSEDSHLQTGELGLACFMFMLVLIPELAGYSHLALYLLQAAIQTILILLGTWILILAARGGLEFIIQSSPLKRFPIVQAKADVIVNRSALLANLFIFFLTITLILVVWRVYENPTQAIEHILQFGFDVGSRRVTVGLIFTAVALLYGAFLASWVVQAMLMAGVLSRRELQAGVRFSMARLVHYSLVVVGFLLALLALGVQFRDITIIGGALGVGIGFGLQSVVNNFVSGLILLFERPIKVGDYVEIAGQWGEIKRIGLRATIVETFDRSEVVVPNSELVSTRVTNWTLSHRIARLVMPVGVAYGSDVPLVMQTLKECADDNAAVMRSPAPQILFRGFGDSSLNFELRVWIADVGKRLDILSELHQEVDQRFRLAGVVIAFPQRDLHVRSVDESAASESRRAEEQRLRVVPRDDDKKEGQ
jgi:small-conductance mechanosensitive channel